MRDVARGGSKTKVTRSTEQPSLTGSTAVVPNFNGLGCFKLSSSSTYTHESTVAQINGLEAWRLFTARRAEVARRPVVVRAVEHSRACANLRGSCFVWVSIFLLGCGSAESSSPKTANQRQLMDVMITGSATAYLRGGMFSILYPLVTDARKCTTTRTQHDRSGLSY